MTAGLPGMTFARLVSVRSFLKLTLVVGSSLATYACGGGEDSSTAQGGGGGNHAPTISGTPGGMVMSSQQYSFTPGASDTDGDTLTFTIANKPGWAAFSTSTGQLSGTPGPGDVGTYSNIQITVSDGAATANLAAFSVQVVATATGSATLTWMPPTQNTDGSALTDLAGYKIYWGQSQGTYPNSVTLNNAGLTSYVVEQLTPATWYFVATAINSQGMESAFSTAASKVVQ
jgi:hypothetical protein